MSERITAGVFGRHHEAWAGGPLEAMPPTNGRPLVLLLVPEISAIQAEQGRHRPPGLTPSHAPTVP
jgi:hypothetical protein